MLQLTSSPLSLDGAMYFFSNTTALDITDAVSGATQTAEYEDAIIWMSAGSCLGLSVAIPDSGMASLYALSSGAVAWDGVDGVDECAGDEATLLIGAGSVNEHAPPQRAGCAPRSGCPRSAAASSRQPSRSTTRRA